MKALLLVAIASLAALPAHAQTAEKSASAASVTLPATRVYKIGPENVVRHIDGKALATALNSKKPNDALAEVLLSEGERYRIGNTLRDRNGVVEFHDYWYDHIFVQEGEAKFLTGGTMIGAVDTAPGEKRAVSIDGGTSTVLHAGDYFLVPPRIPHQMLVQQGQKIRFVVFKVRK